MVLLSDARCALQFPCGETSMLRWETYIVVKQEIWSTKLVLFIRSCEETQSVLLHLVLWVSSMLTKHKANVVLTYMIDVVVVMKTMQQSIMFVITAIIIFITPSDSKTQCASISLIASRRGITLILWHQNSRNGGRQIEWNPPISAD